MATMEALMEPHLDLDPGGGVADGGLERETPTNTNTNTELQIDTKNTTEEQSKQEYTKSGEVQEKSPKEHPLNTPYNRRIQKSSQYYDAWQQRTSIHNSPTKSVSTRKSAMITPRKLPSIEKKERIASLTEQNEHLSREVKVLCKDKHTLAVKVSQLEGDLRAVLMRTEQLMQQNSDLSEQVQGTKIQISAKDAMMTTLAKAKSILESEKQYLQDDKGFLESQLLEMNKKLRETAKRADEAEATVTSVVQQVDTLNRNLARMSRNDAGAEVQEIVKQMELHSVQACKDILKKELKKLTNTVIKSREEASEAKILIENYKSEEAKYKADVSRLEKALKSANEYSSRLEKQEKLLKSNIELFNARVQSLENELSFVRAEKDNAIKEKIQKEAATGGIEAIKSAIHILHENAQRGHEQVVHLSNILPEIIVDKTRSSEASKSLEKKARELGARSTTVATSAEEQLVKLKEQVDALDSALEEAKDAAEDSESKAWQMIAELSSSTSASPGGISTHQTVNTCNSVSKVDIPAATTYVLGLGLLAYSVYISNHA